MKKKDVYLDIELVSECSVTFLKEDHFHDYDSFSLQLNID